MSKAVGAVSGISLVAIVAMVAGNGEKFAAALSSSWSFIIMVTTETPTGPASFLLAWALGLLVMYSLRKWAPLTKKEGSMHIRLAAIELLSASFAVVVFWTQTPTLLGFWVALSVGLSVPLMYRIIAGAVRIASQRLYMPEKL